MTKKAKIGTTYRERTEAFAIRKFEPLTGKADYAEMRRKAKKYSEDTLNYKPSEQEIEKSIIAAAEKSGREITSEYRKQVSSLAQTFVKYGATREEIYESFDKGRNTQLTKTDLGRIEKSAQELTKKNGLSYQENYNSLLASKSAIRGVNGFEPPLDRKSQFEEILAATLKFTETNGIEKSEIYNTLGSISKFLSKDQQSINQDLYQNPPAKSPNKQESQTRTQTQTTASYYEPTKRNTTSIDQIATELKKPTNDLSASDVADKVLPSSKPLLPDKSGRIVAKDASDNPMCTLSTTKEGKIRFDNIGKNTNGLFCITDHKGNHDIVEFKNGNVVGVIDGGGGLDKENKKELMLQVKMNAMLTNTLEVRQGPRSSSISPSVSGHNQNKGAPGLQK